MQFFGSYEENRQDRAASVLAGTVSSAPPSLVERVRAYEGVFTSPFREKLLFGKGVASAEAGPAGRGHLQLAQRNRHPRLRRCRAAEQQLRDGGEREEPRGLAAGEVAAGAHADSSTRRTSRTSATAGIPKPENPDIIGQNFEGLLRIGGRDTEQFIVQQRVSIRDDFSRFLKWNGNHTAQGRRHRQLPGLRRPEAVQRQSAVRLSRRHQLGLPREGELRIGEPRPERQEPPVGCLRAGRLGGQLAADVQPRAPVGLRVGHAEQRLRDPGERAGGDRLVRGHRRAISPTATIGRRSTAPGSRGSGFRTTSPARAGRSRSAAGGVTTIACCTTRRSMNASGCSTRSARSSSRRAAAFATACRRSCGIRPT